MSDDAELSFDGEDVLALTAEITAAYVSNNEVRLEALASLIGRIHQSLSALGGGVATPVPAGPAERPKPAVPISKSVGPDYIVCLEDGKRMKMLKRYLRARYQMTPEDYRRRWNLPHDYPMVAPAYAERRSEFAKRIGLGAAVRRGS